MKTKQSPLLLAIIVYTAAGLIACGIFLASGSFQTEEKAASSAPLYQIAPQLSAAAKETEPIITETPVPSEAPIPEEPQEPENETEAPEEIIYYAFTTTHRKGRLHVRNSADANADIVARLKTGTEGFVLEKGPEWSLIQTGDITGYVYNQYLEFHEIPKEEYHPD